MNLDTSVKYRKIGHKFLAGLIRLSIVLVLYIVFQYLKSGRFEVKKDILYFEGALFLLLTGFIINEVIEYSQKYYEVLTNENYLAVKQRAVITIDTSDSNNFLNNLGKEILSSKPNWLLSEKSENFLKFQTRKKSFINYFIEDLIIIKIGNASTISLESAPVDQIVFLDSARNLNNILFLKKIIKKLRP